MGNCMRFIKALLRTFSAVYRISGKTLREVRPLAEGGYGSVVLMEDIETGIKYAMKKMLCQTEEQKRMYAHEVEVMKTLAGCQHVVGYMGTHEVAR
jgi:serine/threonine protein kinase